MKKKELPLIFQHMKNWREWEKEEEHGEVEEEEKEQ